VLSRHRAERRIAKWVTLAFCAGVVAVACGGRERTQAAQVPDLTDAAAGASGSIGASGAFGAGGVSGSSGAAGASGSTGNAGASGTTSDAGTEKDATPDAREPGSVTKSLSIPASVRSAVLDIATEGTNVTLALEVWGDGEIGGKGVSLDHGNVTLVGYDGVGNYRWHRVFDAQFLDSAQLEADPAGNLYLAGVADHITLGSQRLDFDDDYTLFVAKLSPAGEPTWIKSFRHAFGSSLFKLSVDAQGNLSFVAELSAKGVDFGAGVALSPASDNAYEYYLARFDALGNPTWIKRFTSVYPSMGVDASGASVIAGFGRNGDDLGGSAITCPPDATCLAAAGLDTAGNRTWLKQWQSFGSSGGSLYDLIVRPNSVLMMATYVDFVGDGMSYRGLLNTLDRNAAFVRANNVNGGTDYRAVFGASGNLYLAGTLTTYASIENIELRGTATDYETLFVAGFDAAGAVRFARTIGKSVSEVDLLGVVSTASGLALAGNYYRTLELDRTHESRGTGQAQAFVAFVAP
jgi:hypothetical protein